MALARALCPCRTSRTTTTGIISGTVSRVIVISTRPSRPSVTVNTWANRDSSTMSMSDSSRRKRTRVQEMALSSLSSCRVRADEKSANGVVVKARPCAAGLGERDRQNCSKCQGRVYEAEKMLAAGAVRGDGNCNCTGWIGEWGEPSTDRLRIERLRPVQSV